MFFEGLSKDTIKVPRPALWDLEGLFVWASGSVLLFEFWVLGLRV